MLRFKHRMFIGTPAPDPRYSTLDDLHEWNAQVLGELDRHHKNELLRIDHHYTGIHCGLGAIMVVINTWLMGIALHDGRTPVVSAFLVVAWTIYFIKYARELNSLPEPY